jgi:dihydroxyacetone kinase-like protein
MRLSAQEFKQILIAISEKIEEKKDELSELDRVIGDGDHGVSMSIGWNAIREKLMESDEENDIGAMLQSVSRTFLNAVGASVGPLYGVGFLRGGALLKERTVVSEEDIVQFWVAAVYGIQQMGKAEVGDKTMIDTWVPIASSLENSLRAGEEWVSTLDKAVQAGQQGMESTRDMLSLKGRSGRLGERSKGHIDPGAASAYLIFATFVEAYKQVKGVDH